MEPTYDFDVSLLSYEEWINYFFERRLLKKGEFFSEVFCPQGTTWRVGRPERIVEYLTRLCLGFTELGRTYSLEQINQGIWASIGGELDLSQSIWKAKVPLTERLSCIHSMVRPYADYLQGHPVSVMENCFFMWFDMVCHGFWSVIGREKTYEALTPEEKRLLDALFETLCAILSLDDERCQSASLHGLGHLRHPGVKARVQQFIEVHRGSDFDLGWVEACRDGTVM